jgi:predicted O-methyltransferase YrrM
MNPISDPLTEVISAAWRLGASIDLSGIGYGRPHWGDFKTPEMSPQPYYFFLAGFVRLTSAKRIIEIGTHQGGSTRALFAGLTSPDQSRIVTVDITPDGTRMFSGHQTITPLMLNANSAECHAACLGVVGHAGVDLSYIDADHRLQPTLINFALYGILSKATFVVLDDITLTQEMATVWQMIKARFGDDAIDASAVHPEIRQSPGDHRPGFGVVRLR